MTRRTVMWLVLLAASVRLLALWDDSDSLLYDVGGIDAPQYLDMGRRFTTGEWPDDKPFFWAPGYSLFLGLLMKLSSSVTWLKLAQVALGTASCVLVAVLAARLFKDARVTCLAGVAAALYGPLVYYDLQIAPASLDVFLWLALLALLLEARARGALWLWIAAGVVAAASALTRGAVLLFLPVVALWLLWPPPRLELHALRSHAPRLAALLAPVVLALALVAQHNGGGIFLSYNFGINFLLGNVAEHHATNRVEHPLCLINYKMLVFKPALAGATSPAVQSNLLADEAFAWISQHPGEWLQLLGEKALELVHGEEISRDTSIEASGLDNRVLDLLFWKHGLAFPSGLLIPLALAGIALAPKRSRAHALVLGALAAQALFVLAFFVTTRYRLALWTTALPYAACALVAAFDAVRARHADRRTLGAALLAVVALTISNRNVAHEPTAHAPFEHDHLGAVLDKQGKPEQAAAQWKAALAVDPKHAQSHFQLALHYSKRSDLRASAAHYAAGLDAAPTAFAARLAYADVLIKQARSAEATDQLRRVLKQVPSGRVRFSACVLAKRAKLDLRPDC